MSDSITAWDGFYESGLNSKVDFSWVTQKVKVVSEGSFFEIETPSVTWWARTALKLYKLGLSKPKFDIRWYAPDDSLYQQQTVKKGAEKGYFVKSELKIAGTPAAKMPGEWRVEVYYKEELIEQRPFKILAKDGTVPIKSSTAQSSVQEPVLAQDESYKKAKELFAAGNYNEAADLLQKLLKDEPFRTDAHFALASVYYRQEKWEDSIKELDYVLQNPQYREQALKLRGQVLNMQSEGGPHGKN